MPMGCSRQEYWSGLPFPSPGDLPDPGIKLESPALQVDSLSSELPIYPFMRIRLMDFFLRSFFPKFTQMWRSCISYRCSSCAPRIWAIHGQRRPFFLSLFISFFLPPLLFSSHSSAQWDENRETSPGPKGLTVQWGGGDRPPTLRIHCDSLELSGKCLSVRPQLDEYGCAANVFQSHIFAIRRAEEAAIEASGASVWNVISNNCSTPSEDLHDPGLCLMQAYHLSAHDWIKHKQPNLLPEQDKPCSS